MTGTHELVFTHIETKLPNVTRLPSRESDNIEARTAAILHDLSSFNRIE